MKKIITGLLVGLAFTPTAFAADLIDIINLAHNNDARFQQAQGTYRANLEFLSQARSTWFPIVRGNATKSTYNKTKNTNSLGESNVQANISRVYNITITQPVINVNNWVEIRRSHQVSNQAEATIRAAELDLLIRASNAYFDVLAAKDTLRFTIAEKKALARELDQVQQRFKVGLEAIPAVNDATARYDAVVSREITARTQVENKYEALREITATLPGPLARIHDNIPLLPPNPANAEDWVKTAKLRNFDIAAQHYAAETARYQWKATHAAFSPTVNIVGAFNETRGGRNFGFGSFDTLQKDISVEIASPVFQGGFLVSRARQGRSLYQAALANFDATEKSVISLTRQAYNNVIAGIGAVRADRQAVKSAQSSVESSEAAYRVGTRTIVDVLDAQKELYNAQRQLSVDLYAYVKALLELKRQAGTLNIQDLQEVNSWLIETA